MAVDIDAHSDKDSPAANLEAAQAWYQLLVELGFHPILTDSDGRGGHHLLVVLAQPIPADLAHAFAQWISADWKARGIVSKPEGFPKQASLEGKAYGNWLRLPGRHPKREHWSRVWSGAEWLSGRPAIERILATEGDDPALIPAEACAPSVTATEGRHHRADRTPTKETAKKPRKGKRVAAGSTDVVSRAKSYLDRCQPAISGQSGHSQTYKVAVAVGPGFDLDPDVAYRILWDHYNPRCDPPWSERQLRHKVDEAYRTEKARGWQLKIKTRTPPPEPEADGRVPIEVTPEAHEVLRETLKVLPSIPGIYVHGDHLVSVGTTEEGSPKSKMRNVTASPKIRIHTPATLRCKLSERIDFYHSSRDKDGVSCLPPVWVLNALTDLGSYPGVPRLVGLAECPYPTADGGIVFEPGYDASTGIYLETKLAVPAIPDNLTQADATAAAERIRVFFRQFPFRSDADWSVFLGGMLTAIARPAIVGPVPGFVLNANQAGSGKGLLIDSIAIIASGRECPTTAYPSDPQEVTKVKVSLALSGQTMVHFDNLGTGYSYGSGPLDSALTATTINDRILGQSRTTGAIPLVTSWFLSGNNISPSKDAHRRWLPCCLESPLENPEDREDIEIPDLRGHLVERRAEIVRDCLVIFAAHAKAGRPSATAGRLGSFERWDEIVRGAVHFATGQDPCATRKEAAAESPDRMEKLALIEGWRELPGGDGSSGLTVSEAIKHLADNPNECETLREAILSLGTKGQPANAKQIGCAIRAMAGTNFGGARFKKTGERHKIATWTVVGSDTSHPDYQGQPQDGGGLVGLVGFTPKRKKTEAIPETYVAEKGSKTETVKSKPTKPTKPPSMEDAHVAMKKQVSRWPFETRERWGRLAAEIQDSDPALTKTQAELEAYRLMREAEDLP